MSLLFQIVILVVDSTDRERLTLTKEELHRMLSHEVRTKWRMFVFVFLSFIRSDCSRFASVWMPPWRKKKNKKLLLVWYSRSDVWDTFFVLIAQWIINPWHNMTRKFQLSLSVTQCVVMCLNVSLSLLVPLFVNCLGGILGVSNGNFAALSVTPLLFCFFLFVCLFFRTYRMPPSWFWPTNKMWRARWRRRRSPRFSRSSPSPHTHGTSRPAAPWQEKGESYLHTSHSCFLAAVITKTSPPRNLSCGAVYPSGLFRCAVSWW